MPAFTGDALGIGVRVDRQDFRMPFRTRRVRMDVQLAELPPERLVLIEESASGAEEYGLDAPSGRRALPGTADCPAAGQGRRRVSAPIAAVDGFTSMVS